MTIGVVHFMDLARWILGEFVKIDGVANIYFWDMPVEDNGFVTLNTAPNHVAFIHASYTEWKNTFSSELYAHSGKLEIDGPSSSYGVGR
jgi:predicted dehydrogenase